MGKSRVTVILTEHFKERYRERVGNASPAAQRAWVESSIQARRPKRQKDGKFKVKLLGTRHQVVLAREKGIWVAITVE